MCPGVHRRIAVLHRGSPSALCGFGDPRSKRETDLLLIPSRSLSESEIRVNEVPQGAGSLSIRVQFAVLVGFLPVGGGIDAE